MSRWAWKLTLSMLGGFVLVLAFVLWANDQPWWADCPTCHRGMTSYTPNWSKLLPWPGRAGP